MNNQLPHIEYQSEDVRALLTKHAPKLAADTKMMMRDRVLSSVALSEQLAADKVTTPNVMKARVLEKLLSMLPTRESLFKRLARLPLLHKRVTAGLVLGTFVMTFMATFTFEIPRSHAAKDPILRVNHGDVLIIRLGKATPAPGPTVSLQEGDIVATAAESEAMIVFPDDSVSRLSPGTKVEITSIEIDPVNEAKTEVDITVNKGKVWNKVANIVGQDSSFKVATKNLEVESNEPTAFIVSVEENNEFIHAVDNNVSVSVKDTANTEVTVEEGYTAEIRNSQPVVELNKSDDLVEESKNWIAKNIEEDARYIEGLQAEKSEEVQARAGILPDNVLYPVKQLQEKAKVTLSFTTYAEAIAKLDVADTKLAEATVVLSQKGPKDAGPLLQEYAVLIEDVLDLAKTLDEEEHDAEARELRSEVQAKIDRHRKRLVVFSHSSEVAQIQGDLLALRTTIAIDDVDKTHAHLEYADFKLQKAQELIEQEKVSEAKEELATYDQSRHKVSSLKKSLDSAQQEVVQTELEKQTAVFEALEQMTAPTPVVETPAVTPVATAKPRPVSTPTPEPSAEPIVPNKENSPQFPQLNLYFELEESAE